MTLKKSIVFIGSKKLGLKVLQEIYKQVPEYIKAVITINDREDSRSVFFEFVSFCESQGIDLHVLTNKTGFRTVIKDIKPDLCVVVCWYWIIDDDLLDFVPLGFIGVHHSLLPRYRGGSPLVWQMINGEKIVGSSIFSLSKEMDAGDIWDQIEINVLEEEYISDILNKLEQKILEWFKRNFEKICEEKITSFKQNNSEATYCAQRYPFDGKINWNESAERVYNFIRAQSEPYPGAFTFFKNKKLTIWEVSKLDIIYYGEPGQVAKISSRGVYVICDDNKPLLLHIVQLEGEEKQQANKVIKSIKIRF